MSVEKWWNEICGRRKREKPREKPTQTSFRPPRTPHGGTETRTRDPNGGRRASNRLRHEAATLLMIGLYTMLKFERKYKIAARYFPLDGLVIEKYWKVIPVCTVIHLTLIQTGLQFVKLHKYCFLIRSVYTVART